LTLGCCRQIARADRFVRDKRWGSERLPFGRKLSGIRTGVLGLGRIGIEVAHRLEAFKCQIGYADGLRRGIPYRRFETARALAENSEILFLCAAGGPKGSPQVVGREVFEALGPRGIFVNISRGWLVDEPALVATLCSGSLGAAGLDVFFDEPLVHDALLALDNVVLTPHIASATEETIETMARWVIDKLTS
jgi:hydroxypyruvate reductase